MYPSFSLESIEFICYAYMLLIFNSVFVLNCISKFILSENQSFFLFPLTIILNPLLQRANERCFLYLIILLEVAAYKRNGKAKVKFKI